MNNINKFKLNPLEIIISLVVIVTGLWFFRSNFYTSTSDRLAVRELEKITLNAYPSGYQPIPNGLIELTSFKTKKELSTIDREIYDNSLTTATETVRAYCDLRDRGYNNSEAKKLATEYAIESSLEEKEFYTPEQYKAVRNLYRSAVKVAVSMCSDRS